MATTPARQQQRRRTAAQWTSENPVLAAGELGFERDTNAFKIGDGTTAWTSLAYGPSKLPEIRTGTQATNTVFGGFESEDVAFGASQLQSAASIVTTSGYPRLSFPATGTSTFWTPPFNCPVWYRAMDVHLAVVNDHSATGNIRLQTTVRETDVGTEAIPGTTIATDTRTVASAGANGGLTLYVTVASVAFTPGAFGSVYSVEVSRLGDDGADTLAGPCGIVAIGFNRVDPP